MNSSPREEGALGKRAYGYRWLPKKVAGSLR